MEAFSESWSDVRPLPKVTSQYVQPRLEPIRRTFRKSLCRPHKASSCAGKPSQNSRELDVKDTAPDCGTE
ncbi:hypothetical protein FA13DRAFT_1726216 [Coprinellus micaceus]|uniref:Uncharacterized protein n=1 Tax=Coprinellus micaceus TaxID=71717 RepID=A0A4Y7TT31_COPMI|nr:hypothetical protein FA13DRAFT_1726216 [Coprinellus micaceus]